MNMVGLLDRATDTGQQEVLLGLLSCSRPSHIGLDTAGAVVVMEAGLGDAPVGHLAVRLCAQTQDTKTPCGEAELSPGPDPALWPGCSQSLWAFLKEMLSLTLYC